MEVTIETDNLDAIESQARWLANLTERGRRDPAAREWWSAVELAARELCLLVKVQP